MRHFGTPLVPTEFDFGVNGKPPTHPAAGLAGRRSRRTRDGSGLRQNHAAQCAQVDRPIAGLLQDLKQRGLLEETVVVWATEFGRTPGAQGGDGRDHHPYGFSVWMAGGGIKGGIAHGATDELGFHAVEHRHYVTDIHATVLHQLGLDPHRLEVPGHKRLEIDFGQPIGEILARGNARPGSPGGVRHPGPLEG